MPLILDTDALPRAERAETYRQVIGDTSNSGNVDLDLQNGAPFGRVRYTEMGPAALFTNHSSGTRISLTADEASGGEDLRMVLSIHLQGTMLRRLPSGAERVERPGDMFIMDQSAGWDVKWSDIAATAAFMIPREILGYTRDEEDVAARLIGNSPLYPLLRRHMAELARLPDEMLEGPVGAELSAATIRLVSALLASTKGEDQFSRAASGTTMIALVHVFVRQHVQDHDLDAARIAEELCISRRTLFRLFAREQLSLEQYIISERLQAARYELETGDPTTPIAAIAYRYAFKDARHFGRRFKDRFGMSPQDFRAHFGSAQA